MDSSVCNITTFNKNNNIESLYGILPFSVLLIPATYPTVKGLPHTPTPSCYMCLIRPASMHTGKKYSTDKNNIFYSR